MYFGYKITAHDETISSMFAVSMKLGVQAFSSMLKIGNLHGRQKVLILISLSIELYW